MKHHLGWLHWAWIGTLVGASAGVSSALFLHALDWATAFRETHRWVIALLPLAGAAVGWIYDRYGRAVEHGNRLLIEEIHDPRNTLPLRMAPLVLGASIVTHLFGGSAGREGTAVQMGGALADQLSKPLRLSSDHRRILLMAGISAGFAAVFGTPFSGVVFGLEVLTLTQFRWRAAPLCLLAALVGDWATRWLGVVHADYTFQGPVSFAFSTFGSVILTGVACGLVARAFVALTHGMSRAFRRIPSAPLRPLVGGAIVAAAVWALGTTKYIGLGVPTMVESFLGPLPAGDFVAKLLFTAVTLGAGFKGGEVTPLFFIGATLGNALSQALPLAGPLLPALGFVAVFAGASLTPIASTVLAIEMFGPRLGLYAALACLLSFVCAGKSGIYHAPASGLGKRSDS